MQIELAPRALWISSWQWLLPLNKALAALAVMLLAAACTSAPAVDSVSPQDRDLDRADLMRRMGDYAGALPMYIAELGRSTDSDLDHRSIRARLGRADCRLNLGQTAGGRLDSEMARSALQAEDLEAQTSLAPLLAEAEQLLGDSELALGHPHQARPHYTRALELVDTPSEEDLLWYRLYLCARQERRADAADVHRKIRDRSRPEFARLDQRFLNARKHDQPAPLPAVPRLPSASAASSGDALGVRPRSSWRPAPIRSNKDAMSKIDRVTLHHSGTRFDSLESGVTASQLRSIQHHHQASNGWADIAYHYVVDRAGRIWEGRSLCWQGAHAGNHELNRGNIGVCVLGDYRSQQLTQAQTDSLLRLFESIRTKYTISRSRFYTHREIREQNQAGSTICPGNELTHLMQRFRSDRTVSLSSSP